LGTKKIAASNGNSEDWLASKKNVKKHACKVGYAVRHLMRTGSTYRISESETPAWVRRARGPDAAAAQVA
jgi:hypothetical protein